MDASRSPTTTSDKRRRQGHAVPRGAPQKPRGARAQLAQRLGAYLRHGSKANRRKQFRRLTQAAEAAFARYRLSDIRQLGKRHVLWWDEQLKRRGRSRKTRDSYWYAWRVLWAALGRSTDPPKPK